MASVGLIDGNYEYGQQGTWFLDALRCRLLDYEAREGLGRCGMGRRGSLQFPQSVATMILFM
jgi:hypothetical protein